MPFKIATSPTFWTPVDLEVTAEDGRTIKGRIHAQFKRLKVSEQQEFLDKNRERPIADGLVEIMTGWRDVSDDQGEMTYTPDNLLKFCDSVPGSALAIYKAFFKASTGAREGN